MTSRSTESSCVQFVQTANNRSCAVRVSCKRTTFKLLKVTNYFKNDTKLTAFLTEMLPNTNQCFRYFDPTFILLVSEINLLKTYSGFFFHFMTFTSSLAKPDLNKKSHLGILKPHFYSLNSHRSDLTIS